MAMKPRGGGRGGPTNRPNRARRPRVTPLYEDFRPVSERHQEEEAEKLLIFLPGFMKESIRVSTEGKNTVRVRGERFVGGNKWNRFQEDYQAPDDCNMRGLLGSIEPKIQKSKEESLDQNRTQMVKSGKEVEKKESHEAGGKKVAEKSKELREEFQEKVEQKRSKEKESRSNVATGTSSYHGSEFSIGNLKRSLAGQNEERQLLVNAGAAVLVIMALGAYVYHSIGSGRAE
ncbi:hypothetical protein K7X08_009533 [Anisodus acutangulus]|uniref:Uncharacterized protein n=1 Tax=Anisodus acutangulus TaxID=402998 RepID=A0A9Q1RTQ2_9SOLA|nr:hypothetical protein K7X08_009533 [Anisodus acutangulus]